MKTIILSLALLCSAAALEARNVNVSFDNVTTITSVAYAGKYTAEFVNPATKKKVVVPVSLEGYRKLMQATFDDSYTACCIYNGKTLKVILKKIK